MQTREQEHEQDLSLLTGPSPQTTFDAAQPSGRVKAFADCGIVGRRRARLVQGWRSEGNASERLAVLPVAEHPHPPASIAWRMNTDCGGSSTAIGTVWPLDLVRERDGTVLVLEDPGGQPSTACWAYPGRRASCCALASERAVQSLRKFHSGKKSKWIFSNQSRYLLKTGLLGHG